MPAYASPVSAITALIRPDRYPLSSRYDPRWVMALEMGPHPLWQLEDILPALALVPGSRVLDLGCGRPGRLRVHRPGGGTPNSDPANIHIGNLVVMAAAT